MQRGISSYLPARFKCDTTYTTDMCTMKELMLSAHVPFQTTRSTKALLANTTFVRFLVRVSTHVYSQFRCAHKHLLTNTALVLPSLSLRSFSNSHLFFSYLFVHLILINLIIRYSQTEQHLRFFFFLLFSSPLLQNNINLQNRPRIFRSLRIWVLSSSSHYSVVVLLLSCVLCCFPLKNCAVLSRTKKKE